MIVWEELIACDPDKNKAATNPFFITKAVFIFLFWAYFIIKLNCYRNIFFWDSFIIIIRLVCDSWLASFFKHSYHSRPGCGQKRLPFIYQWTPLICGWMWFKLSVCTSFTYVVGTLHIVGSQYENKLKINSGKQNVLKLCLDSGLELSK